VIAAVGVRVPAQQTRDLLDVLKMFLTTEASEKVKE
jgi:hypothetical protein